MENETVEVNLLDAFRQLRDNIWRLLICAVIGALVAGCYAHFFVTPQYATRVTVLVANNQSSVENEISLTQLNLTARLVPTFQSILDTDTALQNALNVTQLGYSVTALRSMLSTATNEDTGIIKISITCPDAEDAALLANAIAQTTSSDMEKYIPGISSIIIDPAKTPTKPVSPSISRAIMMGAVIGIALFCAYLFLRAMLDNRIKDEAKLVEITGVPLLGVIPVSEPKQQSSSSYSSKEG